jgi:hypothetical protein
MVYPFPATVALFYAGYPSYNWPFNIPFPGFKEYMSLTEKYVWGPVLKHLMYELLWGSQAQKWNPVRRKLGLPSMGWSILTGKHKITRLIGTVWEMEPSRKLPKNFHMGKCGFF